MPPFSFPKKNHPTILHCAGCRDLDLSNNEGVRHISTRTCPDTVVRWASQSFFCSLIVHSLMLSPFFCSLIVRSLMLSPAFLRNYLGKPASVSVAGSTSSCSHIFPSPLANHMSIRKKRWSQLLTSWRRLQFRRELRFTFSSITKETICSLEIGRYTIWNARS